MNMTTKQFEAIINDAGFTARSYSGRGMYGKSCLAVEVPNGASLAATVARIVGFVCEDIELRDDVVEAFDYASTDNLGLGTILYFPKYAM